jgi:hypothetical protein
MTMAEDLIRPGALTVRDGWLTVDLRLPWYRSLPLSCLESLDVAVAGAPVAVRSLAVPGFAGPLERTADSDVWWDLRDRAVVTLDASARPGDVVALDVSVAVRIPYIERAPGVPLVQHATARTEASIS